MAPHRGRPPYNKPYQDREGKWKIWVKGEDAPKFTRKPPTQTTPPSNTRANASEPSVSPAAVDIGGVLGQWASETRPNDVSELGGNPTERAPSSTPHSQFGASDAAPTESSISLSEPSEPKKTRKKGGLTDEQRDKLKSSMGTMAAQANIMLLGLGVRIFGKRQPEMPEDKDTELLGMAWGMQIEEWFGSQKIEPWVLIAGSSAVLGVGMFFNGDPLPGKVDAGAAKSALPRDLPPNDPRSPDYIEARAELSPPS